MTDKLAAAEAWLNQHEVEFTRTAPHQLKIGQCVSYYPRKGTVFVDREDRRRPDIGLKALAAVLREFGCLSPIGRLEARDPNKSIIQLVSGNDFD